MMSAGIGELHLNKERFVSLLRLLVGEGHTLQNWPQGGYTPREDEAAKHILEALKDEPGLKVEHIHLNPNLPERGNIIIQYPADASKCSKVVSFVGSHMDVVYANKDNWERDPFTLIQEEDTLYGRGTTDCLGHCALLTDLFLQLARNKIDLNGLRVVAVIICNEEAGNDSVDLVGVETLASKGYLDSLQGGPLYWLDSADKHPCIGSGGVVMWELSATGKLAHSGFPHKGINAIELVQAASREVQKAFYAAFPTHEREKEYGFEMSSSMKPTRMICPDGSLNQIPAKAALQGDIRLVPFYHIKDAMKVVEETVSKLNTDESLKKLEEISVHGRDSRYLIRNEKEEVVERGKLELKWLSSPIQGLACNLQSPGYRVLCEATEEVIGCVHPLADTGSLPLIADLQEKGFDVHTMGYGVEDAYHADNEFALLSDFVQGFDILRRILDKLSRQE